MWLWIFLIVLLMMAAAGGGWGRTRYGSMSWSPLAVILVVGVLLFFTGNLTLS